MNSPAPQDKQTSTIRVIYDKINDLLGGGNQLFSMQFPAQPLNYRLYQYDTSDSNSVLTRPYTVAEQEFRLSDKLFDVSPITQGDNGEKLSIAYEMILNNYIPKLDTLVPFFRERAGLGSFLLQDSGEVDEKENEMTMIDLCKKLYLQYLKSKDEWEKEKSKKFDEFKKAGDLDGYAKWISSIGMVREQELNSLYNVLVVKGHLHEVMTLLGYLNVSSPAEQLEMTKQRMRNSSRLSLDESMTVYPVQFQPNNWFKALTPNLQPKDLTMAQDVIKQGLKFKQDEMRRVQAELKKIGEFSVSAEEVKELEKTVKTQKEAFDREESALMKQYGSTLLEAAKMCIRANVGGGLLGFASLDKSINNKIDKNMLEELGINEPLTTIKTITNQLHATYSANKSYLQKAEELTQAQARLKQAQSKDMTLKKLSLEERIEQLEFDIQYQRELLAGVYQENQAIKNENIYDRLLNDKIRELSQVGELKKRIAKLATAVQKDFDGATNATPDLGIKTTIQKELKTLIEQGVEISNETQTAHTDETILEEGVSSSNITNIFKDGTIKQAIARNRAMKAIKTEATKYTDDELKKLAEKQLTEELSKVTGTSGTPSTDQITERVEELKSSLAPKYELLPQSAEDAEIDSMFTDIVIKTSELSSTSTAKSDSSASKSNWNVNGWFASAGGNSNTSQATATAQSELFSQDIEIGFRVAKVSFDRGGWFNPSIFKASESFYRLDKNMAAGAGFTVKEIQGTTFNQEEKNKKLDRTKSKFPAFPVAMAIAKDITIKVTTQSDVSSSVKTLMDSSSSSGGGFFGFSASSSSSSSSSSDSAFHGKTDNAYYIRIPGPQVIGYFLELLPEDKSESYNDRQPYQEDRSKQNDNNPVLDALRLFNPEQHSIKLESAAVKESI
jgi:hypothetical protein